MNVHNGINHNSKQFKPTYMMETAKHYVVHTLNGILFSLKNNEAPGGGGTCL